MKTHSSFFTIYSPLFILHSSFNIKKYQPFESLPAYGTEVIINS